MNFQIANQDQIRRIHMEDISSSRQKNLEAQSAKIENVNESLIGLFKGLSHDLGSGVATILGVSNLLLEAPGLGSLSEDQEESIRHIQRSAQWMHQQLQLGNDIFYCTVQDKFQLSDVALEKVLKTATESKSATVNVSPKLTIQSDAILLERLLRLLLAFLDHGDVKHQIDATFDPEQSVTSIAIETVAAIEHQLDVKKIPLQPCQNAINRLGGTLEATQMSSKAVRHLLRFHAGNSETN
ncbi:MAG: hypothetical protein KDE59_11565 [Anaerolineales bacterium]|nr:hypothetical protein [Anaerolineales bacterium]